MDFKITFFLKKASTLTEKAWLLSPLIGICSINSLEIVYEQFSSASLLPSLTSD